MKTWWAGLSAREQRLLLGLTLLLGALLVWLLLWRPAVAERERLRQQVSAAEATLVWLQGVAPSLRNQGPAPMRLQRGGRSLLALADGSAREAGLGEGLSRVEPAGEGRVRVWVENLPFDALITWLESLASGYGVETEELSLERSQVLGEVGGRIQLKDPPGP